MATWERYSITTDVTWQRSCAQLSHRHVDKTCLLLSPVTEIHKKQEIMTLSLFSVYPGGCPVLQLLKWGPPCPTSFPKTGYLAEAIHLSSLWEQGDSRGYVILLILHPQQGLVTVTVLQPAWLMAVFRNDSQCYGCFFPQHLGIEISSLLERSSAQQSSC